MADPCPKEPPEQPHPTVIIRLLTDMKSFWRNLSIKKVKVVRQLGVTMPGQPKTTHQVSLPTLVYFIYATAKEDLQVRPTLNKK